MSSWRGAQDTPHMPVLLSKVGAIRPDSHDPASRLRVLMRIAASARAVVKASRTSSASSEYVMSLHLADEANRGCPAVDAYAGLYHPVPGLRCYGERVHLCRGLAHGRVPFGEVSQKLLHTVSR